MDLVKQTGLPTAIAIKTIDESEQLKTALSMAIMVETGFAIRCPEDMEQAGDTLRLAKSGVRVITDGLREAFARVNDIERCTRDFYGVTKARLANAVQRVQDEMGRWDRAERQRIFEAQAIAQRQAEEAAKIARDAQEQAAMFGADVAEEVPPAAQVIIPQAETTVRGAISTTAKTRTIVAVEIVDPIACAREMPEALELNAAVAKRAYLGWMDRGLRDYPPDGGCIVAGVRYVTQTGFSSRERV